MIKKYPKVSSWPPAPQKYNGIKLQTGEMILVREGRKMSIIACCNGLRVHPLMKGVPLPGYIMVRRDQYPPISEWGNAPQEFSWLEDQLSDGDYTIQEDKNLTIYTVCRWHGKLKSHLRMGFAEMPRNFRYVRISQYPPFVEWREFRDQEFPLKKGEYTIIVNPRTWAGTYILVKENNRIVLGHPYLDGASFEASGLKFVPYGTLERRTK